MQTHEPVDCSGKSNWTKATPSPQPTTVTSSPDWYELHLINVSESINQVNYGLAPSPILRIIHLGTMSAAKTEKATIKRRGGKNKGQRAAADGQHGKRRKIQRHIKPNLSFFPHKIFIWITPLSLQRELIRSAVLTLEKVKLMLVYIHIYLEIVTRLLSNRKVGVMANDRATEGQMVASPDMIYGQVQTEPNSNQGVIAPNLKYQ